MGRSIARCAKRNKKAKSMKKSWEKKRCLQVQDNFPRIFEDAAGSSLNCGTNVEEVPVKYGGSNFYKEEMAVTMNDQTTATAVPMDTDNTNSEVEFLVMSNPNWCSKKYNGKNVCNKKKLDKSFQESGIISSHECENIMNYPLSYNTTRTEDSPISGNRIVELGYVLGWAINLQYNHSKICTAGQLFVKDEKIQDRGFCSTVVFHCTMCPKIYEFSTENPNKGFSSINYGAVWGTLATGSTYSHLEEVVSCMDIPVMSSKMFYKTENDMGKEWKSSLWRSMEAAGVKERNNAIEKSQVCPDGTPWITVYLDGSWSKRSYGTNFNSLSGMVGIVGKHSGELVFIAVRNKFCAVCTRAENRNEIVKQHVCYKNWSGSAPAMEADMAVEGFSCSEMMHNVRYLKFIADGDASVFAKIKEKVSYGNQVQKLECTNHALKNYGKNLRKIKSDTQIDIRGRKLLTLDKIHKLSKRAKCCIYEHGKNNECDVNLFREDLKNNLHHVFGDHSKCRNGICNSLGDQTENKIPDLKATSIYNHLYGANNLLVRKAHMLIANENNNRSERLMNIISRFNMGKRLNLIQRGSYARRVYLSALRYNKKIEWHCSPWKRFTGRSPGSNFKIFIQKHKNKTSKVCKKLFCSEPLKKKNKTKPNLSKNPDYGICADEPEEQEDTDFIMMESECVPADLHMTKEEIVKIQESSVGQFGNPVYEREREKRLTASLFGRVIKRRPYTHCHNLVKACLNPNIFYSDATEYGIAKESVAIVKFEELFNLKVKKSGLWIDEEYGFLAASPDGLVGDEAVVEVKCIYAVNKQFNTLKQLITLKKSAICLKTVDNNIQLNRNHCYYYQIQGQLNITQRNKCYFIVYVNDAIPLYVEEIQRDEKFWQEKMLPILSKFYKDCIAPEIIRGNLKKNQKCVDPPYILDAVTAHEKKIEQKRQS